MKARTHWKRGGISLKKGVILIFLCIYGCSHIVTSSDECTPYQVRHVSGLTINDIDELLQLAYTYAPVLWFYKDFLWEEPFTLIEAEYFIDVSAEDSYGNLKLKENGYSGAKMLQSQYNGVKNPVYVRVTTDEYNGDTYIVIQYWFCYLYNYGGILSLLHFNHEGEWEMIEVVIKDTESVLNGDYPEPYLVTYSRHKSGEAHHWEDAVIEKDEYHPVAYIAYGTHAAYFQDLGWNEDLSKGMRVTCDDMEFIVLDTKEWLHFSGRWGGQENSPYGPQHQELKWNTPVLWALTHLDTYQLHLEHPGHLLVTNAQGERIGFVGEQFVNEIDDAYAVITDEYEYYHLPGGDYSVEIHAEEDIGFDVVVNDNGEATHMVYRHDVVEHLATVYTDIHADVKEHVLQLDKNGDGKIDLQLEPEIMEYRKGYPFYWLVIVISVIILAFVSYKIQRKIIDLVRTKPRKKTRTDMVKNVLEGAAAVFFLLWIAGVFGGIHYETEMLLASVTLYVLSRVISVVNKGYSRGKKVQEVFITVGWGISGLWIFIVMLQYSGWVDIAPAGIDRYSLVAGTALLFMGYTIKVVRVVKHDFRILVVIGGVCIFSWVLARIFSVFTYAGYVLVAGIVCTGIGILGWLKRSKNS